MGIDAAGLSYQKLNRLIQQSRYPQIVIERRLLRCYIAKGQKGKLLYGAIPETL